jgi:uncharacterized membrane protein YfhO
LASGNKSRIRFQTIQITTKGTIMSDQAIGGFIVSIIYTTIWVNVMLLAPTLLTFIFGRKGEHYMDRLCRPLRKYRVRLLQVGAVGFILMLIGFATSFIVLDNIGVTLWIIGNVAVFLPLHSAALHRIVRKPAVEIPELAAEEVSLDAASL